MKKKILLSIVHFGLMTAVAVEAAPIRVVLFNPSGAEGFIFPVYLQVPLIKKMLLNPAQANLKNPVIPPEGFTVDSLGTASSNGDVSDGHKLILALPAYDVVVCVNNSSFDGLFNAQDRKAFLDWARRKDHGVVGIHGFLMDNGTWPEKIAYCGANFTEWSSGNAQLLMDTTVGNLADPNFAFINAGLDKSYMLNDWWMSFQSQPRSVPGIHVLTTVNEATYMPPFKGDHPISWYRAPTDSGRFFYTVAGHDWPQFRDSYWLRRQLYNGILWASGRYPLVDEAIPGKEGNARSNAQDARMGISGSDFIVSIFRDGPHSIEVLGLDGKRVDLVRGQGRQSHTLSNLKANSVYAVLVTTVSGRTRQLIKSP